MTDICIKLDLNKTDLPSSQIKKAVFNHHYGGIKEEARQCKKMEQHQNDTFQSVLHYFKWKDLEKTRIAF